MRELFSYIATIVISVTIIRILSESVMYFVYKKYKEIDNLSIAKKSIIHSFVILAIFVAVMLTGIV